jgi:hypothetical protein
MSRKNFRIFAAWEVLFLFFKLKKGEKSFKVNETKFLSLVA